MSCLKPYSLDNKSREYYLKGAEILIVKISPKKNYCKKKIQDFHFSLVPIRFPICSSNSHCVPQHVLHSSSLLS